MHDSELGVVLISVTEDLVAVEDSPVILELVSLGLEEASSRKEVITAVSLVVAKAFEDLGCDTVRAQILRAFLDALEVCDGQSLLGNRASSLER